MWYQSRTTSCRSGLGTSHFAWFWLAGEACELTRMYLSIVRVTCAKVAPQIRYNMHQTCFVRMVNNIKHRGDVQALWLLAAQKYACVLGSSVCVKQCIVVSEYSCFSLLLQAFEHASARSFVCCISHTAPDIRLTRARFPLLLTLPPSRSSACPLFGLAAVPPPAASSLLPPNEFQGGSPARLATRSFGGSAGVPQDVFFVEN